MLSVIERKATIEALQDFCTDVFCHKNRNDILVVLVFAASALSILCVLVLAVLLLGNGEEA